MQMCGFHGLRLRADLKMRRQCLEERFVGMSVQVADHPVVIHDPKLVGREECCEEMGSRGSFFLRQRCPDLSGAGGTVMSVGDVGEGDLSAEDGGDGVHRFRGIHNPDGMSNAICCGEIIHRSMVLHPGTDQGVHVRHLRVGQEYISRLRSGDRNVVDPVLLFFRTGEFVFLDDPLFVVIYG